MIHKALLTTHPSWHEILHEVSGTLNPSYLKDLEENTHWLPGIAPLFKAFTLPLDEVRYILLGESPYPRPESANGYAFWDAHVKNLWGPQGFDKTVNRATSLRNFLKMLLGAQNALTNDYSKACIAALNTQEYIQTVDILFSRLLKKGFLLLNASLVFEEKKVNAHAKQWRPFIDALLDKLSQNTDITLILWGNIAQKVTCPKKMKTLRAEHPYNLSFIHNQTMRDFFKPMDLLTL